MDTNVFHKVAPAEHVSMRRELPVDDMINTAQTLENRYYQNKAMMDELDIWANQMELTKGDEYLRGQATDGVSRTLEAISENDGAFENSSAIINGLATEFAKNKQLSTAVQNKQREDHWNDWKDQQEASGKNVLDFSRGDFKSVNDDGTLNQYKNNYQVGLDYGGSMGKIWKDILTAEKNGTTFDEADLAENSAFTKFVRSMGIDDTQLTNKLSSAYSQYKDTDEYRQQVKLLEHHGYEGEQLEEAIMSQMLDVGQGYKFNSDESYYQHNPNFYSNRQKSVDGIKAAAKYAKENPTMQTEEAPGITQSAAHFPNPEHTMEKYNALDDDNPTKPTFVDGYNRTIEALINKDPEIAQLNQRILSDMEASGRTPEEIEYLKQALGWELGGASRNSTIKPGSAAVRAELQTNPFAKDNSADRTVWENISSHPNSNPVTPMVVNHELLDADENIELFGKQYSLEDRKSILEDFNKYAGWMNEANFEDKFETGVSDLELTDTVYRADKKWNATGEYGIDRQNPANYHVYPTYTSSKHSKDDDDDLQNFTNLDVTGVTLGSEHSPAQIEVKTKNGTMARITPKTAAAQDFISNYMDYLPANHRAVGKRNHLYSSSAVARGGSTKTANGTTISHNRESNHYELDRTNGSIIAKMNPNNPNYMHSMKEIYAQAIGPDFNPLEYQLFLENSLQLEKDPSYTPTLSETLWDRYSNVENQNFRTRNKTVAFEYANY